VQSNEPLMQNLTETANSRMEVILRIEEEYKRELTEKAANVSFTSYTGML